MGKKSRILVVDDESINLTALRTALESEYFVNTAKNGLRSLEIAQTTHPDLILLDIIMPEMDGYAVCKNLKSNSATQHIPIIFITSKSEYEDEVKGLRLGAVDYITKPFNPEVVKTRVKTHLDLKLYRDHMEKLVTERTHELEKKSKEVNETNIALRVMLTEKDESQKMAEEKMLSIIKDTMLPVLKKIKTDKLSSSQRNHYINVIEADLNHLIEPLSRGIHSKKYQLTPTEIQIADLIKNGQKTKEISNYLNITIGTVNCHRENIRSKLGITNKKINLMGYLLSLE